MVESIRREELKRLLAAEEIQLVDVLPNAEFERSHIPGAVNIPLKTLNQETTGGLHKEKPVAVY